jgi:uncharacterized protein YhhL (DUF1145 family)
MNSQGLKEQLTWIVDHWVLLGALLFVSVYVYFSGYFWILAGLPNPPLAIADISLSAVTLAAQALFAYNIWSSLESALKGEGRSRLILFVSFILLFLVYPVYQLYFVDWFQSSWELSYQATHIVYVAIFVIVWHFATKAEFSLDSNQSFVIFMLLVALVYVSGRLSGMQDLRAAKKAQVTIDGSLLDTRVLRIMSETVVAFDLQKCEVVFLNRSLVSTLRIRYFDTVEILSDEELNCWRRPK